jgi:hypothetical protein
MVAVSWRQTCSTVEARGRLYAELFGTIVPDSLGEAERALKLLLSFLDRCETPEPKRIPLFGAPVEKLQ